jgi:O-antigen/teichoic acid export membrane protein
MQLHKGKYVRNIVTLLSSAVVAQILGLILTPVLTRTFSPEAFGIFNAFVSYSATMALFIFFSIELAIVRPKSIGNLNRIFGLLFVVGGGSTLGIFISFEFEFEFYHFIGFDKLFDIKYLAFLGIILTALNLVLNFLVTRLGIFSVYAKTQVVFVVIRFLITISLFYVGVEFYGLIYGFLFATACNAIYLGHKTKILSYRPVLSSASVRVTARKYKDLIMYNTPASLINALIVNFPVFYVFKTYGVEAAGFFGLAYRIILMPVSLVNKAVGQVLYKELVHRKRESRYLMRLVLKNVMLLSLSFPVFLILYLYGDIIFGTVFGIEWKEAGFMASLMSPYVFLSLVVSPLSYFFVAFDKNKHFSLINLTFLSVLVVGVYIGKWSQVHEFITFYTYVNVFYYLSVFFMIILILFYANRGINDKIRQK